MIIYPVKIYRPNEYGELEYIETIYPDQLSDIHWTKFNRDGGELNIRSKRKYTRVDSNNGRSQDKPENG
tara:strand:- start:13 stop:219 length:207 start_codon:yes stop_codon:yes gene_type:complete